MLGRQLSIRGKEVLTAFSVGLVSPTTLTFRRHVVIRARALDETGRTPQRSNNVDLTNTVSIRGLRNSVRARCVKHIEHKLNGNYTVMNRHALLHVPEACRNITVGRGNDRCQANSKQYNAT